MSLFKEYMPHVHCFLGDVPLTWTMAASDVLIGCSYLVISIALYRLVRTVKVPFSGMILAFGLFIFACGTSHFMEVVTLWHPIYWSSATVKAVTALASVATAAYLVAIRPRLVSFAAGALEAKRLSESLRAQATELRETNSALAAARDELRASYESLERKVEERTRELKHATERLELTIEAGRIGIWEREMPDGLIRLSEHAQAIVGRRAQAEPGHEAGKETLTMTFSEYVEIVHPDDRERVIREAERAVESRKSYAHEYRVIRPDGDVRWVLSKGRGFASEGGQPARLSGVLIDITATKAAEDSLRDLANSVPQLAWTADRFGRITWYNQRWYEYTGTTPAQMQSDGWRKVYDQRLLPEITRRWQESIETGRTFEMEFPIRGADGRFRWFLTRAAGVRDDMGRVARWFGTNTDVDDRARIRAELEYAKNAAENANRLKSAFLANMSHEIRTPLGAILGFADLLKDSDTSEEERRSYVDIILRNGSQLHEIINDILDISKVESNQLKVERRACDLPKLVEETAALMRVRAKEKGISLDVIGRDPFPSALVTDPVRIKQILMNVVSNAVKFTHVGGIRIEMRCSTPEPGKADVTISVVDTGIGIGRSEQAKLFQPFVQADDSISRRYGGTGLGLALSKRLAGLLGGDLRLERSEPNRGSTFEISLHGLDVAEESARAGGKSSGDPEAEAALAARSLEGRSILVVDDSVDNQRLIERLLAKHGARVEFASNGAEGVTAALRGEFDLILMDIAMPVLDGYAATSKLRERGYRKPIIALTAHAMSEVRQRCLNVGYDDHLTKPVDATELVLKARRFIEAGQSSRAAGDDAAGFEATPPPEAAGAEGASKRR